MKSVQEQYCYNEANIMQTEYDVENPLSHGVTMHGANGSGPGRQSQSNLRTGGNHENSWSLMHWTVNDQKRLNSLDRWHDRMLEYHNLNRYNLNPVDVTRGLPLFPGAAENDTAADDNDDHLDEEVDENAVVAEVLKFSHKKDVINTSFQVTRRDMPGMTLERIPLTYYAL